MICRLTYEEVVEQMEQLVKAVSFIEAGRRGKDRVIGFVKRVRCKRQTSDDNSSSAIAIGYEQ